LLHAGGGAPFIAAKGGWQWRCELRPGAVVALKLWAWQSGSGHGPKAIGAAERRCSDKAVDEWAQAVLDFFSNLSKTSSTLKIKIDVLPCFKNSQYLYVANLGNYEQFSQFCRHQIPSRNRVNNPGTDSIFESLMNFKRDLNLLEKSDKFSKIPS
jgi:hypothetical protein